MLAEVDLTLQNVSGDEDEFPWPFAIVPVLLNGHGPFAFGVEIGRGRTMLTEAAVRAIGIDPAAIPEKLTLGGQGRSLDFPLIRLKSLAIGAAELREFHAMVWGLGITWERGRSRSVSQKEAAALQPEWMGIVGFDFLKSFNVTFDFPRKKLRLESVR